MFSPVQQYEYVNTTVDWGNAAGKVKMNIGEQSNDDGKQKDKP
jgi:hypothetical protein